MSRQDIENTKSKKEVLDGIRKSALNDVKKFGRGKGVKEMIEKIFAATKPHIDWKKEVKHIVKKATMATKRKLDKRTVQPKSYTQVTRDYSAESLNGIAIALDVSASMTSDVLSKMCGDIHNICKGIIM